MVIVFKSKEHKDTASFYCYLNHDTKKDFVIDLDNVWRWLEFYTKQKAKDLLEKYFTIEKDYKILLPKLQEQKHDTIGGNKREIIMLNVFHTVSFEVAPKNLLFHLSEKLKREMKIIPPELWSQSLVLYEPN